MPLNQQLVYLVQTDTTAGFLSQNPLNLAHSKQRDKNQPFLICVDTCQRLQEFVRVPQKFKKQIRRSSKSTFIYPNGQAIRVVQEESHQKFLHKFGWVYSSSANLTCKNFEENYAKQKADIIVEDSRGFFESKPSCIYKISSSKMRRLR